MTISLTPQEEALLLEEVLLRADRARNDPEAFFDFVSREQATRRPIKAAPHQRVAMKFMEDHERCVNIWPVGTAKTHTVAMQTLRLLGADPTSRGIIASCTQEQAMKTLSVVSDYILHSAELRLVYPHLRPSTRKRDAWTQSKITVDRPPGIPDASLIACGMGGTVDGARINWIVADDLLSEENTSTQESREKVHRWFDGTLLARLDPRGGKVIVNNTARHPEDLVHKLEKMGWAVLRMNITGGIQISNDLIDEERCKYLNIPYTPWMHPELRPASKSPQEEFYRLRSHDPDPNNEVPLFFERFFYMSDDRKGLPPARTRAEALAMFRDYIEKERRIHIPSEFNKIFMSITRDDDSAMCKAEWVDRCKQEARAREYFSMVSKYRGPNPTFTGVDLAFRKGEEADYTAFFTFESLPTGHRKILDIEFGRWDGAQIADKLVTKQADYNSVVRVENNAAQQLLIDFLRRRNVSLPIKEHTTGTNKTNPDFGVPSVFLDMYNGAWIIPNDKAGNCHPAIQKWIDDCLYYVPSKHTGDILMASWFAREMAREWGALNPIDSNQGGAANIAMTVMSR